MHPRPGDPMRWIPRLPSARQALAGDDARPDLEARRRGLSRARELALLPYTSTGR